MKTRRLNSEDPRPPNSKAWRSQVAILALVLTTFTVEAQSYSVDWYKIAGGGGTSTGSVYSVSGTIGQHDGGGPVSGGNYSLTGGFWALDLAVQTPGVPMLYISRAANTVAIYWQDVSGWGLQKNTSLTAPAGWSAAGAVTNVNGTNYLTLGSPTGTLFFRLTHP